MFRLALVPAVLFSVVFLVVGVSGCTNVGNKSGVCSSGSTCTCDGIGNCDYRCPDGDCNFVCTGIGNCNLTCDGGGCDVSCQGEGNCIMSCTGDYCDMTCNGTGNCIMEDCTEGCTQTCDGTGNCICNTGCSSYL